MTTIAEPRGLEKEERLFISNTPGNVCVAVSGYANYFDDFHSDSGLPLAFAGANQNLIGDLDDDDGLWIRYNAQMIVGPKWSDVKDVSPIVFVAGYTFSDPDSADKDGIHIDNCKWDTVGFEEEVPDFERIRLKVSIRMCGGIGHTITKLGYHLIATGRTILPE